MSGGTANSFVRKGVEIVSLAIKADSEQNYELALTKCVPTYSNVRCQSVPPSRVSFAGHGPRGFLV